MYRLMISLRYYDSESDRNWYCTKVFKSKDECYNYLESNYDLEDPDGRYNFELTSPNGEHEVL